MLLPSSRHTQSDLDLWREHEAADRLHGSRVAVSAHIRLALHALRIFAAKPCYASTSWGKDSVTMLHLLWQVAPQVPVINLRISPTRNPYCDEVRDAFLARFPFDYHEIDVSYFGCGEWFTQAWDRETYRRWDAAWRAVAKQHSGRHISGVRAKESTGRRLRFLVHGVSSENGCAPLGWMSTGDVFGYLAHHDLPVHPNYAMLGGGRWDREHLRVSELGDWKGTGMGRAEWEREYYSDILNRLAAR